MQRKLLVRGSLAVIGIAFVIVPIERIQAAKAADRELVEAFEAVQSGLSYLRADKQIRLPQSEITVVDSAQIYTAMEIRKRSGDKIAEHVQRERERITWLKWHDPRNPNRWFAAAYERTGGGMSDSFFVTAVRCGF
jgi:hypothetical protein